MRTESTANLIQAGSSSSELNQEINFSINNRIRHSVSSEDEADETVTNTAGCTNNSDCCSHQPTGPIVLDIEDLMASATHHRSPIKSNSDCGGFDSDTTTAVYREPIAGTSNGLCSSKFNCGGTSRQNCQSLIKEYQAHANNGLEPLEFPENIDEHQTMQHTVLLILLLCSMFVVSKIIFFFFYV